MAKPNAMLFPKGKHKALTLSYDDGTIHDRKLIQMMNKYHIRGTFNLNSGLLKRCETAVINEIPVDISTIDKEEIVTLYDGHEVAAHTVNHIWLPMVEPGTATYEVITDRKNLEDITGKMVRGFAYPFGTYNDEVKVVLKNAGIQYARTVIPTKGFALPSDFLEWHPTCHHDYEGLMDLAKEFCSELSPYTKPHVFYLWGHSYEFVQKNNWNVIEAFLSYMSKYLPDIWTATNIEIVNYINAFKQLKYSAAGNMIYNPTCEEIWIEVDFRSICIPAGKTITI